MIDLHEFTVSTWPSVWRQEEQKILEHHLNFEAALKNIFFYFVFLPFSYKHSHQLFDRVQCFHCLSARKPTKKVSSQYVDQPTFNHKIIMIKEAQTI